MLTTWPTPSQLSVAAVVIIGALSLLCCHYWFVDVAVVFIAVLSLLCCHYCVVVVVAAVVIIALLWLLMSLLLCWCCVFIALLSLLLNQFSFKFSSTAPVVSQRDSCNMTRTIPSYFCNNPIPTSKKLSLACASHFTLKIVKIWTITQKLQKIIFNIATAFIRRSMTS